MVRDVCIFIKALSVVVTVIGLTCDISGAFILARTIAGPATKEKAAKILVSYNIYYDEMTAAETPQAADLMRDAKAARWGLAVLMLGFALQAAGSTLNYVA